MTQPFRFSVSFTKTPIAELPDRARRAEELGYATISISDHLDEQPAPLIGLTAVAMATSSATLLPLVLANDYRNPLMLAKEVSTLDALSGGRVELGIGAGWMTADYEASGIELDRPSVRIERLAESVGILRGLFGGEDLDHHGAHYAIRGQLSPPLPVRPNGPRLLLAGGKEKMLTLAGAQADIVGINPGLTAGVIDERAGRDATSEQTDQKLAWVRNGAGARFDDIEIQTRIHLAMITPDRQAVAAEMAPVLGISAEAALASPHALVGTVDECIDEIRSWRERWHMSFVSISEDAMEAFAPVVARLAGT